MRRLFNAEGPLMRFLTRLVDLIMLNILWILCSLPIITFGAATTAVYYEMIRLVEGKDDHVLKNFFTAFAKNFVKSTVIWLILMLVGAVAAVDVYVAFIAGVPNMPWLNYLLMPFTVILALGWLSALAWAFVLQSHFENKVKQTLKNALLLSVLHIPSTLLFIAAIIACMWLTFNVLDLLTFWAFLGYSLVAYLLARLYLRIMKKLEPGEDAGEAAATGDEDRTI